jgi:hypothetical protein
MRQHRAQRIGRTPARSLTPLLVQAGVASSLASTMAFLSIGLFLLGTWVLVVAAPQCHRLGMPSPQSGAKSPAQRASPCAGHRRAGEWPTGGFAICHPVRGPTRYRRLSND